MGYRNSRQRGSYTTAGAECERVQSSPDWTSESLMALQKPCDKNPKLASLGAAFDACGYHRTYRAALDSRILILSQGLFRAINGSNVPSEDD